MQADRATGGAGVLAGAAPAIAGPRDYIALLKPRVMSLVVFTAVAGLWLAPGSLHPVLGFAAIVCIAIGAGASGAINMWYDADIDARMSRTAGRPVPQGRITAGEALGFGLTLAVGAVGGLGLLLNWLAAALLACTIAFYVVIYTIWLKRRTPQNIVIGGAAGALPPVVAWAAVGGGLDWGALVLFAIIFLWTPPHFWALALYRADDYRAAGVPMLPVTAGPAETRRQIWGYSLALTPVAVLPAAIGLVSWGYGAWAVLLGAVFLRLAWRVHQADDGDSAPARALFAGSILYLFLIFAGLMADPAIVGWLAH